jgi:hypothetical protein
MVTLTSIRHSLIELEAEILALEETDVDRATWGRFLDTLKTLFTQAQNYHRKGKVQEARLTLNSAFRLLERAKEKLAE